MGKKKKMNEPEFLKVKLVDTVLVGEDEIVKVISFVGGARELDAPPHTFSSRKR